jgi:hypothetical protein
MAEPPLSIGAVQDTRAEASPAITFTLVGLPGTVGGLTVIVAWAVFEPPELLAVSLAVYAPATV